MANGPSVWDDGLQPERTALAWLRTALAVAMAALALVRIAVGHWSVSGILMGCLALLAALATVARARAGYQRTVAHLTAGRPIPPLGPAPLATLSVMLLGLAALAVLAT